MNNGNTEFYEKNLERVNYWLQFAETKNAAAIAFIVAILAVIYSSDVIGNVWFKIVLTIVYVISLIAALISFFPQYRKDVNISVGQYTTDDNILFWKDIAKYSVEDYISKVNEINLDLSNADNVNTFEIEKIFVEEIITNARIAQFKYNMFIYAVKYAIIGTVLFPIFMIIVA